METSFEMLLEIFERAALLLTCLFFITRVPRFKEIFQQEQPSVFELSFITAVFCSFAIFATYSGIKVDGSLVNVRIIAIVSGGILFEPVGWHYHRHRLRVAPLFNRYWRGYLRAVLDYEYYSRHHFRPDQQESEKFLALVRRDRSRDVL